MSIRSTYIAHVWHCFACIYLYGTYLRVCERVFSLASVCLSGWPLYILILVSVHTHMSLFVHSVIFYHWTRLICKTLWTPRENNHRLLVRAQSVNSFGRCDLRMYVCILYVRSYRLTRVSFLLVWSKDLCCIWTHIHMCNIMVAVQDGLLYFHIL